MYLTVQLTLQLAIQNGIGEHTDTQTLIINLLAVNWNRNRSSKGIIFHLCINSSYPRRIQYIRLTVFMSLNETSSLFIVKILKLVQKDVFLEKVHLEYN